MIAKKKWSLYFFLLLAVLSYFCLPPAFAEAEKRVIAIFIFAVFFWAFQIIPLYATSLWVIVLLSFLSISNSGGREYDLFFSSFSNPLILLFFGGFILAAAVRKHRCDEFLLAKILNIAGSNCYAVLGCILLASAFFSMWISNTAAAAMMLALSKPLFQGLQEDDPMRKTLPLAIAFGANIGGMSTPIGTPPNAIALGIMKEYGEGIDFLTWVLIAIPLVLLILVFVFFWLSFLFPPKEKYLCKALETPAVLNVKAKKTLYITAGIIFLWLSGSWHGISEAWIALTGVAVFASCDLIHLEDLKKIDWDILILMSGGLALGVGIEKSRAFAPYVTSLSSYDPVMITVLFSLIALFLSTFISNTAAANLLLPLAVGVASGSTSLVAIPVALSCSLAMALPVSTPPNALAYSVGSLSTKDMVKSGLPIGVVALLIVLGGFQWWIPWFK